MNSIADRSRDYHLSHPIYGYDGANRLSKTWADITGQSSTTPLVSYTYDAFGNQQTVTTRSDSSTSRVTSYDYDSANRVTKIEYPDGIVGDEEFGYDEAGGLLWKKDGNGKFTLYQYDDLRRLIAVYYLPGALPNPISYEGLAAGVTYTYNGGTNQRETMTDGAGTSEFGYDAQGRLKTYTPPLGLDTGYYVEYAYNNAGQKTGVKIWNGTTANYDVSYEYYANGWLKAVKYGGSTIASYSYDAVGNRTQIDYGNGTFTKFDYEATGPRYRLETITHKYGATELAKFGYTRDDVGNPLSISWRQNSTTFEWEYDYDAMNRLASAAPPDEGPLLPLPAQAGGTYAYDWVGNMKAAATSNPWSYNAADQLTLWPGMHSYSYDGNGALTAVKTADGQTEQRSFTYHPSGLMNEAEFNGQTLTNLWDADEHRVQFSIGEDEYTAVFDVTAGIPAVIKETTPQGTIYYVREPGGELLAIVHPTAGIRYYHFDELGSTRLITENSGIVTDRYTYDAYGAVLTHEASDGTIDQPYQYVGQLGYYTHYQAPEFGWLQLGVRFYEPEVGRFERRDPVASSWSAYAYANGLPIALSDPLGTAANRQRMSCNELENVIYEVLKELFHRYSAMQRDIDDLYAKSKGCMPPTGNEKGTWEGHQQQFQQKQNRLQKYIKEYNGRNPPCPPPSKYKSGRATRWTQIAPPIMPDRWWSKCEGDGLRDVTWTLVPVLLLPALLPSFEAGSCGCFCWRYVYAY